MTFPSYIAKQRRINILGPRVWLSFLVNPAVIDGVFSSLSTLNTLGDCGQSFQNFRSVRSKSSNGPYSIWPGSGLRWAAMGDPVQYTVVQYSTFSAVLSVQCSTVYCITIMQYSHSTLYGIMYCITTILQHCTIIGDRPYSKIYNCSNFTV